MDERAHALLRTRRGTMWDPLVRRAVPLRSVTDNGPRRESGGHCDPGRYVSAPGRIRTFGLRIRSWRIAALVDFRRSKFDQVSGPRSGQFCRVGDTVRDTVCAPRRSSVSRTVGVPESSSCSSNAQVVGPSSEESETTPFVREQQSRAALPLLVLCGRPVGVGGDDRIQAIVRAAGRGGTRRASSARPCFASACGRTGAPAAWMLSSTVGAPGGLGRRGAASAADQPRSKGST